MTGLLKVLVVEDEPLIAMLLEDFLDALGYAHAGTADSVDDAIARVDRGGFDVALLDINLGGKPCWPVADLLAERGTPFIFASGGSLETPPAHHGQAITLQKPYTLEGVEAALGAVQVNR